jgi:mono/diheme cytochrome c family protein
MINGCFPKPPFWLTSVIVCGLIASMLLIATLLRSRFSHSSEPRVHFIQDMDNQVKVKTQHASEVFADGRATRPKIPGTVSRQTWHNDEHLWNGYTQQWDEAKKTWNVSFDNEFPALIKVDADLLKHGQKKFNTYCMPCHGYDGMRNGPVNNRAQEIQTNGAPGMSWVQPSNLTDATRVGRPDGHLFNTITNGIRNMGGYGPQIPDPHDRWAIVAYVRALQVAAAGHTAPATQPVAMK